MKKSLITRWRSMRERCGKDSHYLDVVVCEDWKEYANFEGWSSRFVYEGMELDKDIILRGNRVYGPEFCSYVPRWLNLVLGSSKSIRGIHPIGVSFKENTKGMVSTLKKPFESRCMDLNGKKIWLGYHSTAQLAHKAWQEAKCKVIETAIIKYVDESPNQDDRIIKGLRDRITLLKIDIESGVITERL